MVGRDFSRLALKEQGRHLVHSFKIVLEYTYVDRICIEQTRFQSFLADNGTLECG
jgi:hypothetical protein